MGNQLTCCWAKYERATELVSILEAEIFILLKNGVVIGENQLELKRYAFWVDELSIPERVSVLAGEVVHHLRSILDHIIWALALKTDESPSSRIQFPVAETFKKYRDSIKTGILKGVPDVALPLIESMQPYHADPQENSILGLLHKLDIADKHKLLVVLSAAMRPSTEFIIRPTVPFLSIILPPPATSSYRSPLHRAIENGKEIQWIAYDVSDPSFTVQNDFSIEIAFFGLGRLPPQPVIATLNYLCVAMRYHIDQFETIFKSL